MLVAAVALFALAAIIGVYMLTRIFAGALPPWLAVILHGALAATGLVIFLSALITAGGAPPTLLMVAAVVLVIAALGGFLLVSFHLRGKAPPKGVAVIHALAAVVGFLSLAASAFGVA
jgi:hypothetical protein